MSKYNNSQRPKVPEDKVKFNPKIADDSFDVRKYDTLIYKEGVSVLLYPILPCPNVKSIDGKEHDINCKLCNGKAFIDGTPIETIALMSNQLKNMQLDQDNIKTQSEKGTVYMTFLSGINLHYFQKVTLADFAGPGGQLVSRGEGDIDILRYNATQINGNIIDSKGQFYINGTDFDVEKGNLKWISQNRPSKGTIFTINYDSPKQYRAMQALHRARYSSESIKKPVREGVEFPEQWVLHELYLAEAVDEDGQPKVKINDIFPPN